MSGHGENGDRITYARRQTDRYVHGTHYWLLEGAANSPSPPQVWRSAEDAVIFDDVHSEVQRTDLAKVPGAFTLSNLLTRDECEQLIGLSNAMGYHLTAQHDDGEPERRSGVCVWVMDESLIQPIWQRAAALLPKDDTGGSALGINPLLRLYRYEEGDDFNGAHHPQPPPARCACNTC